MKQARLPLAPNASAGRLRESWPASRAGLVRAFLTTREGERLSFSELARRAGCDRKTVENTAYGRTKCTLEVGLNLAVALGQHPRWIVRYTKEIRRIGGDTRPFKWNRKQRLVTLLEKE